MSQPAESAIFRALNEMKKTVKPPQSARKTPVRMRKSESEIKPVGPPLDKETDEILDESLDSLDVNGVPYDTHDVSEEDLDFLTDDDASPDEMLEQDDESEPAEDISDLEDDEAFESACDPNDVTCGHGDDEVADLKDSLIKDLQERITKLEAAMQDPEPVVDQYNSDSVELMESILRKVKAPPQVQQAYRAGKYESCVRWLNESHNIALYLDEGFSAKERAKIKKALNELNAPSFVLRAFENGQNSLVSAFFESKGRQVRRGR